MKTESGPSYKTNDPRGWCGDPSRGAAMGRHSVHDVDPTTFDGRLTLRRVHLNNGGYDVNGTYFGQGAPLYWYAFDDAERGQVIDAMLRARDRADAIRQIRQRYPLARFYGKAL